MLERLSSIAVAVHVDIDCVSLDDVWDVVTDVDSWPERFSTIMAVERLDGPLNIPGRRGRTATPAGAGKRRRDSVGGKDDDALGSSAKLQGAGKTASSSCSTGSGRGIRVGTRIRVRRRTVQGESYCTELVVTQLDGAQGHRHDREDYDCSEGGGGDCDMSASSSSSSLLAPPPCRSVTFYSPSLAGSKMSATGTWTVETVSRGGCNGGSGSGTDGTFVRATRTVAVIPHNLLVGAFGKVLWGPSLRKRAVAMAKVQADELVQAVGGRLENKEVSRQ
uniref:Uncharacterized protein n=1 Tax=Pseudictyota dubia TaxID=2749911 RepID=A0A7R9W3N5_9STRA